MKQIRIKDNSFQEKEFFSPIEHLTGCIADKTLGQLEKEGVFVFPSAIKDSKDITEEQRVLQSIRSTYRSSNVMGFLGLADERLTIASRFCCGGNDYFFQYLLSKVLDIPNILSLDTDADRINPRFQICLFLFPRYLKSAMRKGIFKTYLRHDYSDCNMKGPINVAEQIKRNVPFKGNIAYSDREFSYDNSLTELIRHTIEFIKGKPYGNRLLFQAKDEVKLVREATPGYRPSDRQKIIGQNLNYPVRHPYFSEYQSLQRVCLLILLHQKLQVNSGPKRVEGILFDGAWLWEEYLNTLLKDIFYHPMNKEHRGAQQLFNGKAGIIYPDFISKEAGNRRIADAKYKPMDNIRSRDYLQILAYRFRFDAKNGYYLYPESENAPDLQLWRNQGSTYEKNVRARKDILVVKHGLKIPKDAIDYSDFAKKIQSSEQDFIRFFINEA